MFQLLKLLVRSAYIYEYMYIATGAPGKAPLVA